MYFAYFIRWKQTVWWLIDWYTLIGLRRIIWSFNRMHRIPFLKLIVGEALAHTRHICHFRSGSFAGIRAVFSVVSTPFLRTISGALSVLFIYATKCVPLSRTYLWDDSSFLFITTRSMSNRTHSIRSQYVLDEYHSAKVGPRSQGSLYCRIETAMHCGVPCDTWAQDDRKHREIILFSTIRRHRKRQQRRKKCAQTHSFKRCETRKEYEIKHFMRTSALKYLYRDTERSLIFGGPRSSLWRGNTLASLRWTNEWMKSAHMRVHTHDSVELQQWET